MNGQAIPSAMGPRSSVFSIRKLPFHTLPSGCYLAVLDWLVSILASSKASRVCSCSM